MPNWRLVVTVQGIEWAVPVAKVGLHRDAKLSLTPGTSFAAFRADPGMITEWVDSMPFDEIRKDASWENKPQIDHEQRWRQGKREIRGSE